MIFFKKNTIFDMKNRKKDITIRSAAAEYLTFVAATGDNPQSVEMRYEDENIWLTQKMLATLYDVDVATINEHLKNIFDDTELSEGATIRNFLIVQTEGNRLVNREIKHYNLQAIIALGFKINNDRAVQFRKWANQIVKDYTIQGWVMDTERLKNNGSILTEKYFDLQLQKIREIRISERKFYQKITDLYATALDYDTTSKTTKIFFASVQNKMHFAIHGNTAIVTMYLDYAEYQTRRHIPMTMEDWKKKLDVFLKFNEEEILNDAGRVTHEIAKSFAESEFEKYRIIQDQLYESDYDRFLALENRVKEIKNMEKEKTN